MLLLGSVVLFLMWKPPLLCDLLWWFGSFEMRPVFSCFDLKLRISLTVWWFVWCCMRQSDLWGFGYGRLGLFGDMGLASLLLWTSLKGLDLIRLTLLILKLGNRVLIDSLMCCWKFGLWDGDVDRWWWWVLWLCWFVCIRRDWFSKFQLGLCGLYVEIGLKNCRWIGFWCFASLLSGSVESLLYDRFAITIVDWGLVDEDRWVVDLWQCWCLGWLGYFETVISVILRFSFVLQVYWWKLCVGLWWISAMKWFQINPPWMCVRSLDL